MHLVQNSRNDDDSWDLTNKINEITEDDQIQITKSGKYTLYYIVKEQIFRTVPESYSVES